MSAGDLSGTTFSTGIIALMQKRAGKITLESGVHPE